MHNEIKREDTRNLEAYISRLQDALSKTARKHKINNLSNKNVGGQNTGHIPYFSNSSIINSSLWKNSGEENE